MSETIPPKQSHGQNDTGETIRRMSTSEIRNLLQRKLAKPASGSNLESQAQEIEQVLRQETETDAPVCLVSQSDHAFRFSNWDAIRQAQRSRLDPNRFSRIDVAHSAAVSSPPAMLQTMDSASSDGFAQSQNLEGDFLPKSSITASCVSASCVSASAVSGSAVSGPSQVVNAAHQPEPFEAVFQFSSDNDEPVSNGRRKPLAVVLSTAVHVALLLVLATVGLQVHRPKDQVAFSASPVAASETEVETLSIEQAEIETPTEQEVNQLTPEPIEYEIDPVGDFEVVEFKPPPLQAETSSLVSSITRPPSAIAQTLQSEHRATAQFCGVDGGGSHFAYLVDSSQSMREAFPSARQALFSSIDQLEPNQRFYVIFYDSKPDFMQVSSRGVVDSNSVYATPENKAALRRWVPQVSQDRGKAPYEALQFALDLRPDAIFLLSDGSFPEKILDLLKQQNRIENVFGDVSPISIIHTIAYYDKAGESIMRRIAKQNGGQFQYVPKP